MLDGYAKEDAMTLEERLRRKKQQELLGPQSAVDSPESEPAMETPKKPFLPTPTGGPIPAQEAPKSLADTIQKPEPAAPEEKAPSVQESSNAYKDWQKLGTDLEANLQAAGNRDGDVQELRSAIQAAKEQRDSAVTRNEWLEAAQTLATAVVQGYAASQGGGRTDMSRLPIAQIDYGKRMDRAGRDFESDVGSAKDIAGLRGKSREETKQDLSTSYKAKSAPLEEKLREEAQTRRENASQKRAETMQGQQNTREDNRFAIQDRKDQMKVVGQDYVDAKKEATAFRTLVNNQDTLQSLKGKSGEKLKAALGPIAAQAEISTDELEAELKATDTAGMLWGTNTNPEARQQVIENKLRQKEEAVARHKNLLDSLSGLKARNQGGIMEQQAPTQQSATVRIQAPDGTIAEVPREKAAGYVQKGGKIVR